MIFLSTNTIISSFRWVQSRLYKWLQHFFSCFQSKRSLQMTFRYLFLLVNQFFESFLRKCSSSRIWFLLSLQLLVIFDIEWFLVIYSWVQSKVLQRPKAYKYSLSVWSTKDIFESFLLKEVRLVDISVHFLCILMILIKFRHVWLSFQALHWSFWVVVYLLCWTLKERIWWLVSCYEYIYRLGFPFQWKYWSLWNMTEQCCTVYFSILWDLIIWRDYLAKSHFFLLSCWSISCSNNKIGKDKSRTLSWDLW